MKKPSRADWSRMKLFAMDVAGNLTDGRPELEQAFRPTKDKIIERITEWMW